MQITIHTIQNDEIRTKYLQHDEPESSGAMEFIYNAVEDDYFFMSLSQAPCDLKYEKMQEWLKFHQKHKAGISYACHDLIKNEQAVFYHPIPYTTGSVRDDFNFGPLVLISKHFLEHYLSEKNHHYQYAGWYAFRLFVSKSIAPKLFAENCYAFNPTDNRKTGSKQFDYTNPANRGRQLELEHVFTEYLDDIAARLSGPFKSIDLHEGDFEYEASIIIPVLNREKTILNAVESALSQQTNFPFNVLVVNNHSSDETGNLIGNIDDERLIHLIPEEKDLGIGGCWNKAVQHPACGRFAVQLDSDDLYKDETTLQQIVDQFHQDKCGMVIGSYELVDFMLNSIPPGLIDHKEWTDDNGPNNALRINGLGAPRAFYTPLIRKVGFPNVSYGEDYAVGLAISREYKVGRIYQSLYLCRRWSDNTDADLDEKTVNRHNLFKDSLRSYEIEKRKKGLSP